MAATIRQIQTALGNAQKAGDQSAVVRLTQILERAKAAGAPEGDMPWSEVGSRALANASGSLYKFGADIGTAVMHPLDTANAMLDLTAGGISRGIEGATGLDLFPENQATATADAVGHMYRDRYGSMEGFKRSLAEDPVGVASDLSLPLGGLGELGVKAGGVAARVGKVAKTAANVMDPISATGKVLKGGGKGISALGGYVSGVGEEPLKDAFNASRAGGARAAAYKKGLRQPVDGDGVVDEAMARSKVLKQDAQNEYRQGIAATKANTAPIDWNNIFQSVQDSIKSMTTASGRFYGGEPGKAMVRKILDTMQQYVADPALHNAEGLDALKQELAQLQITPGPGTTSGALNANRLVTHVLDGIKAEIGRVEPSYSGVMDRYQQFKDLEDELQRTLSLNDKASTDTALRKLQSTMRNNVQTNYGGRGQLLDTLDTVDRGNLKPGTLRAQLAGQSLNTWMPRGIARAGSAMTVPAALAWLSSNPAFAVGVAPFAAMASPRVLGEVSGLLGKGAAKADKVAATHPAATAAGKAALARPGRTAIRQAGAITNEADAMMEDAKGNLYDRKGRLIRRAAQ